MEVLRSHFNHKMAIAEEARAKLMASERELNKKVKLLESYLALVERQGLLPEAVHFRDLLNATKHLIASSKYK